MQRRGLSKSKLLSSLQCSKRLWLEVHRPELVLKDPARERAFSFGHEVGEMARQLRPGGVLIGHPECLVEALAETRKLLGRGDNQVLFEAAIEHDGVLIRADILELRGGKANLCEVKASGSVKDYHFSDAAIQTWVIQSAGVKVDSVAIQHIDTGFVYPGDGYYQGLFSEVPVTNDVEPMLKQVPEWVAEARGTLGGRDPEVAMGKQCADPYPCPFVDYCSGRAPKVDLPLTLLPYAGKTIPALEREGFRTLRDIPDGRLKSDVQERVRRAHLTGERFLAPAVAKLMREFGYPRTYLDFETVGFAVPVWKGTRPYQQVPFQWSMHIEGARANTSHHEFLDLSGELPAKPLIDKLLAAIPDDGPVFAYNAGFERQCLVLLGNLLPVRRKALGRVCDRLVDLYPITRGHYYHPDMHGSWSLKAVMPTIPGGPDYALLEEIQEGSAAQDAYFEAVSPDVSAERKRTLETALLRYCAQDTEALLVLARFLQGRAE